MKKFLSNRMKVLCIGLLLATQSCSFFKRDKGHLTPPDLLTEDVSFEKPEDLDRNTVDLLNQGLEQNFEDLFETHGILINEAILTAFDNDSQDEIDSDQTTLLENVHDIANIIGSIYGLRIGERFEVLFSTHIKLSFNYIYAIKNQNPLLAKQLSRLAFHNADLFVEFFNKINPFFAYEPERQVFHEHLTLEADLISAYFTEDFMEAEGLRVRLLKQSQEMARHFAKAIEKQIYSQNADWYQPNDDESNCDDSDYGDFDYYDMNCCETVNEEFN